MFGSAGRWFCATRFLGATVSGTRVTAYVWALCEETKATGRRIAFGTGDSLPVVVHLRRIGTRLEAVGREEPRDAPYYGPDVRRLFPGDMADWILGSGDGGDAAALHASVVSQARGAPPP